MPAYWEQHYDIHDPAFAASFDEVSLWGARFGILLLDHLALAPDRTVLDLACGTGFPLLELAQAHGASCRCIGLDLWAAALQRAQVKQAARHLANVALVQADAMTLPLADHSCDLIVSNLGLNNFADPAAVLRECRRVAKPQARLAFTSNLIGHMAEFYTVFRDLLATENHPHYLARLAANEAHRGSRDSICALLTGAGLTVTRLVEDQFQLRFLDGSTLLRHFLVQVGFLPSWRAVLDPPDEARVLALLESRLNDLAARDGQLVMTIPMLYVEAQPLRDAP
ncbi:MAG: methyltransferase domain-containing protein [Chloroflexota bacterium]|nr:methyltransferase domain-containing protein [Chloroflexota bacterium]